MDNKKVMEKNVEEHVHSSTVCDLYTSAPLGLGPPSFANSCSDSPAKSKSKSRSSSLMELVNVSCVVPLAVPSSFPKTSKDSDPSSIVVDCFNADPLGRLADASSEVVDSFGETSDDSEPFARCEVMYGLPLLDVLLGNGDMGRLFD